MLTGVVVYLSTFYMGFAIHDKFYVSYWLMMVTLIEVEYRYMVGNRRQFLSSDLHDIGIGIEKHEKYQFVLVLIMASKA